MSKKKIAHHEDGERGNICFTIMPFGEWFDYYYENIFCPAIEDAGLVPRRADDLYRPSAIVHDIWALTQSAKMVLADLSGKNPNVFYELGLAHAIAKPAILVTDTIDDVPFDLRALRVLVYNKNEPEWGKLLREKISSSIREILASPLESVLPTFLKVRGDSSRVSVTAAEKEFISIRQDIDLLKRELQGREEPFRRRPSIDPPEAQTRIRSYVAHGMPDDEILRRMVRYGVPEEWVRIKIAASRMTDKPSAESAEAQSNEKGESKPDSS
jgi:hypothetical protein